MLKMFARTKELPMEVDGADDGDENAEEKRTVEVKLRLTPTEAASLRRAGGKRLSQYVVGLHERVPPPAYDLSSAIDLERLRDAFLDIPRAVRDLHYGLNESSANIARIFSDPGRSKAFEFRPELMELRNRLRDLADDVLPTLKRLEDAMIEPRERIVKVFTTINEQNERR